MHELELLHPEMPQLIDAFLKRSKRSWQSLERGEHELAGEPLTVDSLQWWLINADPLLWIETNLVNKPEDGGGLWRMFDYQRTSLRFRGHVVHQDGAEVGKSREIVGLLLWGSLGIEKGSSLVGSALDGDLDELWEEIVPLIPRRRRGDGRLLASLTEAAAVTSVNRGRCRPLLAA